MLHRSRFSASLATLALLTACGEDAPPLPDGPLITAFEATPATVEAGSTAELTWTTLNAQSIRIFTEANETLIMSSDGTGTVRTPPLTTRTVFFLEARNGEQVVQEPVTVDVQTPGEAPTVDSFSVSPNPVDFEAEFTVEWAVTGATSVRIALDGTEVVSSAEGSGSFSRMATRANGQLLVLEATNAAGTTTRNLPVNVTPPAGLEVEPNDDPNSATLTDAMGVATARLEANDVDFFEVTVAEGGWIRAETTDGMGGCQVDLAVQLTDGAGSVLANGRFGNLIIDGNGQAIGACQIVDPRIAPGARELSAGTYYVRVSAGPITNAPKIGDYTLQVTTGERGCGNAIIETGEQCDDGNTQDGDTCSSMCLVPNLPTISSGDATATVLTGSLEAGGSALVQLDAQVASTLVAEVGNPVAGGCDNQMRLVLLDSTLSELGDIAVIPTNNGNYPCGRIDPDRTAMLSSLATGTYYVRAEAVNGDPVPQYGLRLRVHPGSGCGNGYRETMELCDDGNANDADHCRSDCTLNPLPLATAQATIELDTQFGPFQRVRVRLAERATITATISSAGASSTGNCGVPTFMGLIAPTSDITVIGLSPEGVPNCGGIDQPEATYAADLAAGDYDLVALTSSPSAGGLVTITTAAVPFACGNGILERSTGEACDDGNSIDTDGCRNDCSENSVRVVELEPNDEASTANTLTITAGGALTVVSARFATNTDVDVFEIELPEGASLRANTYTTDGDRTVCQTVDTVMFLLDAQGNEVTNNDDISFPSNLCSRIGLSGLAAGRYFLRVQPYQGSTPGAYFLDILAN